MKTSELTGAALDWAVAKCEKVAVRWSAAHEQLLVEGYPYMVWQPHKNWAQGGPIIERERMKVFPNVGGNWTAQITHTGSHPLVAHPVIVGWSRGSGPTPLIAAMRCYVASKLGDDVEIPEELT